MKDSKEACMLDVNKISPSRRLEKSPTYWTSEMDYQTRNSNTYLKMAFYHQTFSHKRFYRGECIKK